MAWTAQILNLIASLINTSVYFCTSVKLHACTKGVGLRAARFSARVEFNKKARLKQLICSKRLSVRKQAILRWIRRNAVYLAARNIYSSDIRFGNQSRSKRVKDSFLKSNLYRSSYLWKWQSARDVAENEIIRAKIIYLGPFVGRFFVQIYRVITR